MIVVFPLIANAIRELGVKPFPPTVSETPEAPAGAKVGEMSVMPNVEVPPKDKFQAPRPCVAAKRVREARCMRRDRTATFGKLLLLRVVQVAPPLLDKNTPISVAAQRVPGRSGSI